MNKTQKLPQDAQLWNQDTYEGSANAPPSLHKFLYANANPMTGSDPSGLFTLQELKEVVVISGRTLGRMARPTIKAGRKGAEKIICGAGVASIQKLKGLRGHHRIPKFLGGAQKQDLLWIDEQMHQAFHMVLHMILQSEGLLGGLGGAGNSAQEWRKILRNPETAEKAMEALEKASNFIDKVCKLKPPANLRSGLGL